MNVYLAGRFSRLPEIRAYADELESLGITVTSRWLRGTHEWTGTPEEEIPTAHLARWAREDLEDLTAADAVVCFTEPARSGPARGGRHVEMGYALARGMDINVVGGIENVFYALPAVRHFADWRRCRDYLLATAAMLNEEIAS